MDTAKTRDPHFCQKLAISIAALIVFSTRLIFPSLPIDGISLGILAIAVLPWLSSLIKSAELPGVGKIEFQDIKSAADKAAPAEEEVAPDIPEAIEASYLAIADQNPGLALVGLRIEIEKRLRSLAEKAGMPRSRPLAQLTRDLLEQGILTSSSAAGLRDLISLGNQAAHGVEVSGEAAFSAVEYGPRVLKSLDSKLRRFSTGAT